MGAEKVTYELSLRDLMSKGLGDINTKLSKLEGGLGRVEKEGKKTSSSLTSAFGAMRTAIAGLGLFAFEKQIVQTTAKFQSLHNSIKFASDGAIQGGASVIFLSQMSKQMGLEITAVTEGFKTFQGAMVNTKFSSSEVRTMFKQVSTGVTAMGLSAEDAKGTFLALGQIMGKGKVQAEELRGQIGERVPGAFSIAARAMGVTTSELDKMMANGKLLAEDFLPKFAAEMEKTFGGGAVSQADSLTASINRMSNGWTELMVAMGNSQDGLGGIFNWIGSKLDGFADRFRSIEEISKRSSNERLIGYLDNVDAYSKNKKKEFQAKGLRGSALADALSKEGSLSQVGLQRSLVDASARLNSMSSGILSKEGVRGKLSPAEADKQIQQLILNNKQGSLFGLVEEGTFNYSSITSKETLDKWQKERANVQFLKDALAGTQQVFDKTADSSLMTSGSAEMGALKKQSEGVSGGVPKVVNINIESLMKDVKNYFGSGGMNSAQGKAFLEELQDGLNTIVLDTGIVAQYGR